MLISFLYYGPGCRCTPIILFGQALSVPRCTAQSTFSALSIEICQSYGDLGHDATAEVALRFALIVEIQSFSYQFTTLRFKAEKCSSKSVQCIRSHELKMTWPTNADM